MRELFELPSRIRVAEGSPTYEEINKYTPSDIDDETATAVDKFRKANRLLAKKLEDITDALDKEKSKNAKLQKQVKIKQFHQG